MRQRSKSSSSARSSSPAQKRGPGGCRGYLARHSSRGPRMSRTGTVWRRRRPVNRPGRACAKRCWTALCRRTLPAMVQFPRHAPPRHRTRPCTEGLCRARTPLGGLTQLRLARALGRAAARPRRPPRRLCRPCLLRRCPVRHRRPDQPQASPCGDKLRPLKQAPSFCALLAYTCFAAKSCVTGISGRQA